MDQYLVGVDLGQSRDYTAIAVVERAELKGEWDPAMYAWRKEVRLALRHLERVPLGTPYDEVIERVVRMTRSQTLAGRCRLVVDGTGVGRPVVDLLRQARPGCLILPVIVTSAEHETESGSYYHVPKCDLITGVQVLLQGGRLAIAAGIPFGEELEKEMAEMRVKVSPGGREQYGAWREGTHDDLVFAVALACWAAGKVWPKERPGAEAWWTNRWQAEAARVFRRVMER